MSFVGNIGPDIAIVSDSLTTANLFTARTYYDGEVLVDPPSGLTNTRTGVNVQPTFGTFAGAPGFDFGNDWYFRVHIIPTTIDLGNLVSAQNRTVSVWNAFLTAQPYTQLQTAGFDGISLVQPAGINPPTTLNELQFITYGLTIDLSGPPTIDASVTFTIAGEDFRVPITGRRVILMPFAPNWTSGVEETLTFRSTVTRSWDGTEQRRSLRAVPRRRLAYTALLTGLEVERLDNLLYGWQGRLFAVPLWAEPASLLADAAVGDSVLTANTASRTFAAGGLLALWRDSGVNEVREITSIVGDTVTLRSPLTNAWPAGSRAYPAMVSSLASEVQAQRLTESVVQTSLAFDGEPSTNIYPVAKGTAAGTYRSEELYLDYANWADGIEMLWASDRLTIDQGSGQFRTLQRSGFSTPTKSHNWTLRNHGQVFQYRQWLQRREGRAQPFFCPTGFVDFTLAADANINDNAIDVQSNGYDLFSNAASMRRDIAIQLKNGTTICRRITAANPNANGTTKLQLDSSVGVAFAVSDVKRISLLGFFRLASDAITFNWLAEGVAQVQAGFTATKT
jgi:hypothetical protein